MAKFNFLKSHIGNLDEGVELINQFYWHVEIKSVKGKWYVKAGEKTVLEADSRDEVDTFLYGMSLAYSVIPDYMVKKFREDFFIE